MGMPPRVVGDVEALGQMSYQPVASLQTSRPVCQEPVQPNRLAPAPILESPQPIQLNPAPALEEPLLEGESLSLPIRPSQDEDILGAMLSPSPSLLGVVEDDDFRDLFELDHWVV